jgi:hypothetical protein
MFGESDSHAEPIMAVLAAEPPAKIIRWHYLWYVAVALIVMTLAIISHNLWFLNFLHVFCGLLWTGIDLFVGFVLGPILRQVDIPVRREIAVRLTPRTLFLMPTLAAITGTTGWYLAGDLGYLQLDWPQFGWVAAALVLITLMTMQGLGYLLPTNLRVCFELQKANADPTRIADMMRRFFAAVAVQGTMQVLTIIIMARFRTGF